MYVKLIFEACISQGNVQEFEGIAVVEKKVVLYGSIPQNVYSQGHLNL